MSEPLTQTLPTSLGHRITAFKNDVIGKKISRCGMYEKETLLYLNALLAKIGNAVVLDVGANIGNHALAFSTTAASVHAFEPLPEVFALLNQNVQQNELTNIHLYSFALSDENGSAPLYQNNSGNVGGSSFHRSDGAVIPITVLKRNGDEVIRENDIPRVDLLKIDVEAHEIFVLQGLMETIKTLRPFIMMEWADQLTIERMRGSEVMRFLEENYIIRVLGTKHERMYWEGQSFAWLKRKLARALERPYPLLYGFDPERLYRNLLLIPNDKAHLLPDTV